MSEVTADAAAHTSGMGGYPGPAVTPDSVAQVLEDAADYIEVKGHHKGDYVNGSTGAVCAMGAIYRTTKYETREAMWVQGSAVKALMGRIPFPSIPRWNDAPERTAHEVIDELKLTAKDIRNGEIEI